MLVSPQSSIALHRVPLCAGLARVLESGRLENAAVVGALGSVMRRLRDEGDAPIALVGYSLGGRLALQLAAAQPDLYSRVAIISGSAGLAGGGRCALIELICRQGE